jgi:hypothetical protein
MDWLFASGHAADLILVALAIEAGWLRLRHGWSWRRLAIMIGTAALIVLGLRGALVGAAWWWIALPLALSLPLHLLDLAGRLEGQRGA